MRRQAFTLFASAALITSAVLSPPSLKATAATSVAAAAAAQNSSDIAVNGFFSVDPANQGSSFRAAIVMDIPGGLHVNGNKPLGKYAIPTTVKIDAPKGLKVTPVTYPAAKVRSFDFGSGTPERLAVYEGRSIMRFNVAVAPDAPIGVARVRASVRFQSCSDTVSFPPATRDLVLAIAIVGAGERVNNINAQYFGGGRGRKR
ncbi:MAG TPA: protein-disulfide reductase DsbD domain-containing protein [Pyrinomonadaceae bacterium]|nr:protein-disulfide reductase DsbD domain-containing protein [Pyrinomonadaceae bacterium]